MLETILGSIILAAELGTFLVSDSKASKEEKRRTNTPCLFVDGFSASDFSAMALKAGKQIKRLSITVDGPVVKGTVKSQSGISEWSFTADFNDYGHITGKYWISSRNSDSSIPKHFAENLAEYILNYKSGNSINHNNPSNNSKASSSSMCYCPYCGKRVTVPNLSFCSYCGEKFPK